MPLTQQFAINPERVVHETLDGETIIIQLETGTYYSLAGPGAEMWAMLAAGRSTGEVVDELRRRYDVSAEALTGAATELVRELQREELLEETSAEPGREIAATGAAADDSNGARAPFDSPQLKKYTDMQYFLMLDPIHEVDGSGWPTPASGPPGG